ncbi:acyl-CoA carboxylase epsilon subunit [Streptomyces sp. N50]|uniref:acyl-CoA carboxylase epsilon subunit n=1 Tax=Streptomyces sp. N50 TaxID=3081765 RepID=UPI002962599F|nr:acyl-CoA carboxylase epsilon subunit [Streptomyces sp. N50]WOX17102.1 acyl-CoA carboxylase epsilon subunit [Streptomyces sp. N50]
MSADGPAAVLLTVRRGTPTRTELAALTAVLAMVLSRRTATSGTSEAHPTPAPSCRREEPDQQSAVSWSAAPRATSRGAP